MAKTLVIPPVINQEYEYVAVDLLKTHPRNSRQGDRGAIYESIKDNGFFGACIVQKSTGYILAGNHRYLAALDANIPALPVIYVDVDNDRALRILLSDNKTSDDASYNTAALAELLAELANTPMGLAGSGFSGDDLDLLISDLAGSAPPNLDPGEGRYKEQYGVIVVCENEGEQERAYNDLTGKGYTCRVVVT